MKIKYVLLTWLGCCIPWSGFADNKLMDGDTSFWQCSAYDSANHQWLAKNQFKRAAINKAYAACKEESNLPETCQTANEFCEAFIKGVSMRPKWQCSALDKAAHTWQSDIYPRRHDAIMGAKELCKQQSVIPDSCHVDLITCKNLNIR